MVTRLQPSPHSSPHVLQGLAWLSPPSGLPSRLGGGEGAARCQPSLPHGTGTVSHPGPAPSPPRSATAPRGLLPVSAQPPPAPPSRTCARPRSLGGREGRDTGDRLCCEDCFTHRRTVTTRKRMQRPHTLGPVRFRTQLLPPYSPSHPPPPRCQDGTVSTSNYHEDGHVVFILFFSSKAHLPAPSSARHPSQSAPATPAPASRLGECQPPRARTPAPGPPGWVSPEATTSATPTCQVREGLLCPSGARSMSPQGPATPVPSATAMPGLPPRCRPPGDNCSHPAPPQHPVSRPLYLRLKQHIPVVWVLKSPASELEGSLQRGRSFRSHEVEQPRAHFPTSVFSSGNWAR